MNLPNKITTFRMISAILLVVLLLFPYESLKIDVPMLGKSGISIIYLIAFILFVLASFSDFLDGYIARKYNMVTTYGKFMDPIADKLLVNSALIILATQGPIRIPVIVVVVMISRDILVDALRLISIEKGKVIAASYWGKAKTMIQMIAIALVLINNWPFSLISESLNVALYLCYLAGLISLISCIDYLVKSRSLFKKEA